MNESEKQNIICLEHIYGTDKYQLNTDAQSEIDLNEQPKLSISGRELTKPYIAFYISKQFVVFCIDDDTNTLIKIEHHPQRSIPLHIHIVETLDGNIVIFVIFTDHILRIRLTNTSDGYSFEECKTNFSFSIPSIEIILFRILLNDENQCLRVHLVLDETCSKKFVFYQITLMNDDERIFYMTSEVFFRLPPNMIEIIINPDSYYLDDSTTMLLLKIETKRKVVHSSKFLDWSNQIHITINHEKEDYPSYSGVTKYGDDDKIFLLTKNKRCYLVPLYIDKLRSFKVKGFKIVATMKYDIYRLSDDEESGDSGEFDPEITKYIISLMGLNNDDSRPKNRLCGSKYSIEKLQFVWRMMMDFISLD